MKASVVGYFRRYTIAFEGDVPWMYQDIKGLMTVANGNLIEPMSEAKKLPFRWRSTRVAAVPSEIEQEWTRIKSDPTLATAGHRAAGRIAQLELSDGAIGELVRNRLMTNEIAIARHPFFASWQNWPADAQLGVMSMAWAVGVSKLLAAFPKFLAAAREMDFAGCARECTISEAGNPGVKPRNEAQRVCFSHAERVIEKDLDREYLNYPDPIREGL